jgi:hypothetical protein
MRLTGKVALVTDAGSGIVLPAFETRVPYTVVLGPTLDGQVLLFPKRRRLSSRNPRVFRLAAEWVLLSRAGKPSNISPAETRC